MRRKRYHKRFIFALTDEQFKRLDKISKKMKKSRAVVVRELIEKQYLILFDKRLKPINDYWQDFYNELDKLLKLDFDELDKLSELKDFQE